LVVELSSSNRTTYKKFKLEMSRVFADPEKATELADSLFVAEQQLKRPEIWGFVIALLPQDPLMHVGYCGVDGHVCEHQYHVPVGGGRGDVRVCRRMIQEKPEYIRQMFPQKIMTWVFHEDTCFIVETRGACGDLDVLAASCEELTKVDGFTFGKPHHCQFARVGDQLTATEVSIF